MNQHVVCTRYQKRKIKYAEKETREDYFLRRVGEYAKAVKITGQFCVTDLKVYHVVALEEKYATNASVSTFQKMIPSTDGNLGVGKHIDNIQDAMERWGPFLYTDWVKQNQNMVSADECFPEFGTTSDDSPLIGNTEAV